MYSKALNLSFILALIVVILGAYTRLADAGLGCPDWPGCYGQLLVPDVISAEYDRPLDIAKAWTEMIHRYAASILGLSIVVIFLLAIFRRPETLRSVKLPTALLLLVSFQGALGMWTVTELVHPGIVTMHLLGGFSTTTLLFWLLLNERKPLVLDQPILAKHQIMLAIVTVLLIFQIFLGGWTSTNYARCLVEIIFLVVLEKCGPTTWTLKMHTIGALLELTMSLACLRTKQEQPFKWCTG